MPRRLQAVLLALVLAAGMLVLGAPAQAAAPDHIGLAQLRTMLAASPNGIAGYFLTVAGGPTAAQQDPVPVRMTVRAVADNSGPAGDLILFEADMTDPVMQNIGGIAAGMSGSPLYIDDGGTFKVIGALSYGDYFTLNGLGLATPIEDMIDAQTDFPAAHGVFRLDHPVRTDSAGTVDRIRIGETKAQSPGTVTMRPAFGLQLSGIPKGTAAYRRFEKLADRSGLPVLSGGGGQCSSSGFTAPFTAGNSLGAYYTLGSVNLGGYGTVTYVDGNTAMGFGHPMNWVGPTDLFATNVWISGIWGSSYNSYKIGCPGQVQGALTQDRSAAVGIDVGATTSTIPVTSQVSITTDTTRTGTAATDVAAGTFDAGLGDLASAIVLSEPLYRLANQSSLRGSARTTTTVKVSDGTESYTITRPDVWSSSDVLGDVPMDAAMIVAALYSTPGLVPTVQSVDLVAEVDQTDRSAVIVGVTGGPLQVGPNTLNVTLKPQGRPKVVLPVPIDIPATAMLDGGLSVDAGSMYGGDEPVSTTESFDTLGDLVTSINSSPSNNEFVVTMSDAMGNPVRVGRLATDYALDGSVSPGLASGALSADLSEVTLGDTVHLQVMLGGAPNGAEIALDRRVAGGTSWERVGGSQISTDSDGMTGAGFDVTPDANATYRATWNGDASTLGWSATTDIAVMPPLDLSGVRHGRSWALQVTGAPEAAGSPVTVQARRNGAWKSVATGTLGADGTASLRWQTGPAGVRVRAVQPASTRFAAVTSAVTALSATELVVDPDAGATKRGNVTVQLRSASGKAITGVRYRVQRRTNTGWEPVDAGRLRRTTRVWLANGEYRVAVPKQDRVPAAVRQQVSVGSAAILITRASGGSAARVSARPRIPLRFTVQRQQAGRWQAVGGWRRLSPPAQAWSRDLPAGRYRFVFPDQAGFDGATSGVVRVR
ncbi:MAG TPA: hypothetical protein PLT68_05365 [Actinomycetota bacterium]|nr:hypothetical protein [Actinomycetota bacterium]